jgi:GNAT superfamily N-acetyltransferase
MEKPQVLVRPVTAADWDDVATVFGTKGDPAGCWCQWFQLRSADWRSTDRSTHREALRRQVTDQAGRPPGVLAWSDGEPVGWCLVGPRPGYPRLAASTKVRATGDNPQERADERRWVVLCFVVPVPHRRQGLTSMLLDGAIEFARAQGATSLEAYPVDPIGTTTGKVSSADMYHGALSTFLAAGFTELIRTGPARPIVRLALT